MQHSSARLSQQNIKLSKAGSPMINNSSPSPPLTTVVSTLAPTNESMLVPRTSPLNVRKSNTVQIKEMSSNIALDDVINSKVIKSNFNEMNILETTIHEKDMPADVSSNSIVKSNADNINTCVLQYNESSVNNQTSENSDINIQLESSTNDEHKVGFVKEDDQEESVNSSCGSIATCSSKRSFAASGVNKANPVTVKIFAQKVEDKEMVEEHSYPNNVSPVSFLSIENNRNGLKSDKSDNCEIGNSKDSYILITEASSIRNSNEIAESSTGSLNFPHSEALQVCSKQSMHPFSIKSKDFCSETTMTNKVAATNAMDTAIYTFNAISNTNATTKSNTLVSTTENLTKGTNASKASVANTILNKYSKNSSESVVNTYKQSFVNSASNACAANGYTCSALNTQNVSLYTNSNLYGNNSVSTHSITTTNSSVNGSAMLYTNSIEYMQQQNHIFVFSTQLANKGAEAVLNGQFPTIIAYHCTQPSTRNFLEDFFFKNSIKMKKLQRESNLNVCQISIGGNSGVTAQSWPPKSHKVGNYKSESLLVENEVLYWNRSRQALSSHTGDSNPAKIPGSVECDIKSATLDNDINVPSLQGVKVPDENLTPQQRQHREEQLAKLKKMNQFLFPESGCSTYHSDTTRNSINKLAMEDMVTLNSNGLNNIAFSENSASNKITHSIRNATSALLSQSNPANCNNDIICGAAEILLTSGIINDNEIPNCLPNTNSQSHVNNPTYMNSVANSIASNLNLMGNTMPININQITNLTNLSALANTSMINQSSNELTCRESNSSMHESMAAITPNSAETLSAYNTNFINENSVILPDSSKSRISHIDINHSENQNEWSRLHYQFYEQQIRVNVLDISQPLFRNNMSNSRPTPPPPYHTTQRSASVPITAQSPNPSSPNNHTSNLSLPSPCASGVLGNTTNSPNLDAPITANLPITSSAVVLNANSKSARSHVKANVLISSPGSSMTRLSPNRVDNNNVNNLSEDTLIKASSLKSGSPLIPVNNTGENTDIPNVKQKLSTQALSYPTNTTCSKTFTINQNVSLERKTVSETNCMQFNRQLDNIPLNPNSQRISQHKLTNSFDPISSLTQMSQQLTGGNSVNMGNNVPNIGVLGVASSGSEANSSSMENIVSVNSCTSEQCNIGTIGNIQVTVNPLNSYVSNNSQIMMASPMGLRLTNSKACGGNLSGFNKSLREINSFPGSISGTCSPNKMPTNCGNFNVTSNIQVKSNTPNTIQYMPVRSQSTGSNKTQTTPSLEFLQRFANPQLLNSNAIDNSNSVNISHINLSNEPHKVPNILNNIGTNVTLFNNNSQLNSIGATEQDEHQNNTSAISNNVSLNASLFRGIQHLRQSNGGQDRTSSPHYHPSAVANSSATHNVLGFPISESDSMNINESTHNAFANNATSLYQSRQNKMLGIGHSSNATNGIISNTLLNNGFVASDQMSSTTLQSPVMLNSNALSTSVNVPMNYKTYIGPNASNLKYAQQYHSFQQQLYATSTRNHLSNQSNVHSNTNINTNYFINK